MFRILKERMRFFYWLPRILAMLFIGFLSLFALDVFIPGQPLFSMIGAFLIHLIPSFILIGLLLVAWKKEEAGGILFILIAFFMFAFFRNPFWTNIALFGPLVVIGILFLLHWYIENMYGHK